MSLALNVKGVSKGFDGTEILRDISLEVEEGSLTVLLGPSGSGKTTLLRCVAGFERIDRGRIEIDGVVVDDGSSSISPERRKVGFVPQDGSLFPHLNVERNVLFGLPRRQRKKGAAEGLLKQVGLAGFESRRPSDLSGGQRQRVALARALALNPSLILLDEPFAALDASLRAEVRDEVISILQEIGATAVLVTHDQDEALSIADHVCVLKAGTIIQSGTAEDLYTHPHDPDLARFLGEANILSGQSRGDRVDTVLGPILLEQMVSLPTGDVKVVLRPEHLTLVPVGAGIDCIVVRHRYHGHDAMTHVVGPNNLELVIRHEPTMRLNPGDRVGVIVTGEVLAFPEAVDVTTRE